MCTEGEKQFLPRPFSLRLWLRAQAIVIGVRLAEGGKGKPERDRREMLDLGSMVL